MAVPVELPQAEPIHHQSPPDGALWTPAWLTQAGGEKGRDSRRRFQWMNHNKKNTPVLKPWNGTVMFKLFSKGDQLKIKLANFKCAKIENRPWF